MDAPFLSPGLVDAYAFSIALNWRQYPNIGRGFLSSFYRIAGVITAGAHAGARIAVRAGKQGGTR
jgi:hypothetical protein